MVAHFFWLNFSRHSKTWLMVDLLLCLWYMFLFQLSTIAVINPQQQLMDTTLMENSHALFTSCCRKLRRLHPCNGGGMVGILDTKSFESSYNWWEWISFWHSRAGCAGQSWEPIIVDWTSTWCPALSRRLFELIVFDRCFGIAHRTGYELLLHCTSSWWGWRRSFLAVQQAPG